MKFKVKRGRLAMLLVPALALAAPAFAQVRATTLSDSQEPGSVIVFPKFIQGSVTLPEGSVAPITELEIGVVCPKGVICPEHTPVKIRAHWVCGTTEADLAGSFTCKETDFDITATVNEKIVLTPNSEAIGFYGSGLPNHFAPGANCPNGGGYLIAWVINTSDQPIKFDGLIGDAHLRPGSPASGPVNPFAGSALALADYAAIPIQADPALANNARITTNGAGALLFDGGAGHYQAVSGEVLGDIRYTNTTTGPTFTLGAITLLTLDVRSNRPNNPTFVDIDFYGGNPSAIGNENLLSGGVADFICWGEFPITALNPDATTANMGRKGVFISGQATKVQFTRSDGVFGPVPVLGLAEVLEGGVFPPVAPWPRVSFTNVFNLSNPVTVTGSGQPPHFSPAP